MLGDAAVIDGPLTAYGSDATEHEGLVCLPGAAVAPGDTEEVRTLMEWAYARDVPLVPRGGGTGFSGGAVPVSGASSSTSFGSIGYGRSIPGCGECTWKLASRPAPSAASLAKAGSTSRRIPGLPSSPRSAATPPPEPG